ncbi:uncharacterized protein LOC129949841 isoform X2 [Eupeodes corollae]|uniref:uncharacterized protein LOC129949841 isoform X2 n=1 Tax=Eupeodes corollae TaxID=290404 RepID=UPI0024935500|nr:uncharacterized protein LOC129949841 isoform X2 [Eupeodes corollae]
MCVLSCVDFMKICDLCHVDGLQDCNSTNIFHINMTINCEMTNKMCTLGINELFEGFENLTMHDIDMKHICIFKEMSKESLSDMSTNLMYTESHEQLETTSKMFYYTDKIVSSVSDDGFGDFKTTLENDLREFSLNSNEHLEITSETSFVDLKDNQKDEINDPSFLIETTSQKSWMPNNKTDVPNLEESFDMQHDEPVELDKNESSGDKIENSIPGPVPPSETIVCYACDSSTTEACLGRIEELKTVDCPKEIGCISYYSNGNLIRNCGSLITPEDENSCRKPNNLTCDSCLSDKCNNKLWQQCFKCNSKDNPNCALWSSAETVPLAVCPSYNDNCLVRVTKTGETLRDCSPPSDDKCAQDELCSMCEGPLCNSGVFPPTRLQCIQCQECEDAQDPNNALPCLHYNTNEKCFLYVTAKSKMIRGCVSNVTAMQECQLNEPKCKTCNKQNGCNSVPLMKEPSLSCSKCKSKDNPHCIWEQPETEVSKCTNKFLYYLTETCLTQFDPATEEVVRDCSFDYGVCTPEDLDCQSCPENGCNRGSLKVQHCIQCQSDHPEQIECQNQAAGIPSIKCPHEKQTFENRGCFTLKKENVTSRGCVVNLSTDDLKLCKKKGQNSCRICMKDSCNNISAPSRSSKIELILVVVLLSLFSIVI